jgi:Uncharacterized conserved protein
MRRTILAVAVLFSCAASARAESSVWKIAPARSKTEFRVKHMMVATVNGRFGKISGTVTGDPADPAKARVDVAIDAASIDTGVDDRDDDLRSEHFFNVAKHPVVTFRSKSIRRTGDGLAIVGDLTMRGVTLPVALDVHDISAPAKQTDGSIRMHAEATATLNRKEFGMTWNKALDGGGVLVSDQVWVSVAIELVKSSQ